MYCNIYHHFCLNTIETLIYKGTLFEVPSLDIQLHHPFMSGIAGIMFQHSEKGLCKAGRKFTGLSWQSNYPYSTNVFRNAGLQPKYLQDEYVINTAFLPFSLYLFPLGLVLKVLDLILLKHIWSSGFWPVGGVAVVQVVEWMLCWSKHDRFHQQDAEPQTGQWTNAWVWVSRCHPVRSAALVCEWTNADLESVLVGD